MASSVQSDIVRISTVPTDPDLPTESGLMISMPQEWINYTLVVRNETVWTLIDGEYPMYLSEPTSTEIPMLYPTPPNTTNIHIWLDGDEVNWFNYSDANPYARHHTDIGDWEMIYCSINPVSEDFTLAIHYEHPVEIINGSYTFLYDLNIESYLSPTDPISTAYFRVSPDLDYSDVTVYSTGFTGQWSPMNFTRTENGNTQTLTFNVTSEYAKPLLGDIVVSMNIDSVPEFQISIYGALVLCFIPIIVACRRTAKVKKN